MSVSGGKAGVRPTCTLQVFPQAHKERMAHLALGRLRPVLDLGKQLGLNPKAAMPDALARARRKSSSRAVLPGGCFPAASLNRRASSASSSSNVSLRLVCRCRTIAKSPYKMRFGNNCHLLVTAILSDPSVQSRTHNSKQNVTNGVARWRSRNGLRISWFGIGAECVTGTTPKRPQCSPGAGAVLF